jgi:hypothetical protein
MVWFVLPIIGSFYRLSVSFLLFASVSCLAKGCSLSLGRHNAACYKYTQLPAREYSSMNPELYRTVVALQGSNMALHAPVALRP